MEYHYEYRPITYNSHHKVLVNLQASNMDALKNRNYGLYLIRFAKFENNI